MNGVYFLVINISKDSKVKIGALASILFEKGNYVYVGSAMNGLENRIARHLMKEKKLHWHIDYLLASKIAKIAQVFVKETAQKAEECITARKFAALSTPVPNFGCGDCRCEAHLFNLDEIIIPQGFSEYKA